MSIAFSVVRSEYLPLHTQKRGDKERLIPDESIIAREFTPKSPP